jgi:hypothetical protein
MLVHEPIITNPSPVKYKVDNVIPYGCLKNGIKQTLKNMTRNNRPRQTDVTQPIKPTVPSAGVVPSNVVPSNVVPSNVVPSNVPLKPVSLTFVPSNVVPSNVVPSNVVPFNVVPCVVPLEKTIIKRHVIGKSKKSRHVGVLIKNASTRKMITDEYKKLKKTNIAEVKTQLKNNGLLKVGSTAPADILRQTYESSILAGLVKNDSEGTTYHNFMNEENNK